MPYPLAPMRIALLVPDPSDELYAPYAAPYVERYRAVLAAAGVEAVAVPWTASPPPGIEGAVPILAWGYHLQPSAWLAAIDRWAAAVPLVNGAGVLRWNTRKTYLRDLRRLHVPVVPTLFAERVDGAALAEARRTLGTEDVVVKPQVSGAGHRTWRLRPGESPPEAVIDAMIQPFLPEVGGEGELSLFYFGGSPAHAVRKVAAPGEFRVQAHLGGTFTPLEPPEDARTVADIAIHAAAQVLADLGLEDLPHYARIDLVRGRRAVPLVMEFEAIEPDLYLDFAPDGGRSWAEAIRCSLE